MLASSNYTQYLRANFTALTRDFERLMVRSESERKALTFASWVASLGWLLFAATVIAWWME